MNRELAIEEIECYWEVERRKICGGFKGFEYFLDEYVWIENKTAKPPEPIKLVLWQSQREKIEDLFLHRLLAILKAHQLGYTWIFVAAYCLWRAITEGGHHIVINSFNEDVGTEILVRMDFIIERLPHQLMPECDRSNTVQKVFNHKDKKGKVLKSVVQVIPATEKGGQSKVPTILVIDESCQNRYVRKTFEGSKPGIDTANGQVIVISNAIKGAVGWGWTRGIYTDSMKGDNTFHRIFLPWQANPNRPSDITKADYFKTVQLQEGMDEETFSQRYPESEDEAISAMLGSYFGNSLARHNKPLVGHIGMVATNSKKEPEFSFQKKGILEVWRYPYYLEAGYNNVPYTSRYCMGSDVSEGLGQTYSVAYVYDRLIHEFVARIRSNRVDAHTWARMLFDLSLYYWNAIPSNPWYTTQPALICAETTGAGQTTVKELKHMNANLYVELAPGKVGSEVTKRFGWHETNQKKHDLSEDLRHWFKTTTGRVHCPILIEECSTWIRHENGRIGPEDETKLGDCVIAAGLTIQADYFMGGAPKPIDPPAEGWRSKFQEGRLIL